jgi:UDPglucose--hexose-1-phosphate uridylyltransferase
MNGVGAHEVIVSGTSHENDLAEMSVDDVARVVRAWSERYQFHCQNPRVQYVLVINNHLKEAGASLEHPHTQLFGIPLVPPSIEEELAGMRRYQHDHGRCVYCDIIRNEDQAKDRVIFENDQFLVYAPYASRTPFESHVIPKRHETRFETMTPDEQRSFAQALHQLTGRITKGLNNPPFNFYIHTLPCHAPENTPYHWHLELLPKLAIAAGFELGSGVMINVATPESAAEFLRGVELSAPSEAAAAPALH